MPFSVTFTHDDPEVIAKAVTALHKLGLPPKPPHYDPQEDPPGYPSALATLTRALFEEGYPLHAAVLRYLFTSTTITKKKLCAILQRDPKLSMRGSTTPIATVTRHLQAAGDIPKEWPNPVEPTTADNKVKAKEWRINTTWLQG